MAELDQSGRRRVEFAADADVLKPEPLAVTGQHALAAAISAELAGLAGNWACLPEHIRQTIATLAKT